jgi:hypothetical protein
MTIKAGVGWNPHRLFGFQEAALWLNAAGSVNHISMAIQIFLRWRSRDRGIQSAW